MESLVLQVAANTATFFGLIDKCYWDPVHLGRIGIDDIDANDM